MKNNSFNINSKRKNIFNIITLILMIILIQYFNIQIIKNDEFIQDSDGNRLQEISLDAPRGSILDRNKKTIVSNRSTYSLQIYP